MNALNDLTTEVRFRERMRGYDFEEVDGYVKAVSRAVAQGRDQISELQRLLAQTESPSGNENGVPETRELLLRTLVLAQRTADAAVSEARIEAKSITDFAQERAAKTVAEAEAAANARLLSAEERAVQAITEAEDNCQLILAESKRTAAAELATERARKVAEIQALEATRAELEAATATIQARLDNERSQLRGLSISLQSFVEQLQPVSDDSEPLEELAQADNSARASQVDETPEPAAEISAAEPEARADRDAPGESVLDFPPDPGDEPNTADQDPGDEPNTADQEHRQAEYSEDRRAVDGSLADVLAANTLSADTLPDLPPVGWHDEAADRSSGSRSPNGFGGPDPVQPELADSHPSDVPEAVAAPVMRAPVMRAPVMHAPVMHSVPPDSPELFDIEAEDDDEFIEQLRQVVSSDAPLPNADAAMAAFFDHDEGAGRGSGAVGRGSQRA